MAAAKEADRELLNLLEDSGFEGFDEFLKGRGRVNDVSQDNVNEDFRIDYAQIEEIVHFMLTELSEEGNIYCGCRAGDTARYDFEFCGDRVRVFCHTCGYEKYLPMSSTLAANAFLHTDRLILEPGETKK